MSRNQSTVSLRNHRNETSLDTVDSVKADNFSRIQRPSETAVELLLRQDVGSTHNQSLIVRVLEEEARSFPVTLTLDVTGESTERCDQSHLL